MIESDEGKRYDRFRDRIMFPILNQRGAVIGFGGRVMGEGEPKYLNSPETPLFEKGRELYGLFQARDAIRDAGRVLVVEGYMDVVALAQFGVGYAVATLGTATTPVHVQKLLRQADEVVFCFDGDNAGRKRRVARAGSEPAARHRPQADPLPVPAGGARSRQLRARARPGSVRADSRASADRCRASCLASCAAKRDLATAEGRVEIPDRRQAALAQDHRAGLKLQLLKEVAALADVSQDEVETLLRNAPGRRDRSLPAAGARAEAPRRRSPRTEQNLLALRARETLACREPRP